jgi:hypothetical protein
MVLRNNMIYFSIAAICTAKADVRPPPPGGNVLVDWSPASVGSQLKGQLVVQIDPYNTGMSLSNRTDEFVVIST